MIPDGDYTAVVDQIEDTLATLEVSGDDERYSLVVDEETLPEAGQHVDAVLQITIVGGELVDAMYDSAETERRKEASQRRFDRLSKRPPSAADETGDESDSS